MGNKRTLTDEQIESAYQDAMHYDHERMKAERFFNRFEQRQGIELTHVDAITCIRLMQEYHEYRKRQEVKQ